VGNSKSFEEFDVWKNARLITNRIYDLSGKGNFATDFALKNQMRSAAISIMSNIGEGHERGSDKENIQFLSYAKGSAGEVRSQLYIAFDRKYITREEFEEVYALLINEGKMLGGYIKYIKDNGFRGNKFRK
jgi:four helix bundle protein